MAAVLSGIGAGCVYRTCVGNALKWLPGKRGLTAAGFGAGAAVTVISNGDMIQSSGYEQAFLFFGIGQGVVIFVLTMFLLRPSVPTSITPTSRIVSAKANCIPTQMIKTSVF